MKPSTPAERPEKGDALLDLSRGMLGEAGGGAPADVATDRAGGRPAEAGAEVELALSELIGDRNGEVVIYNDSGFRTLAIATEARVVDSGRRGSHVTGAGEDVSGFRFVTFDNGTTVYYQDGLDLLTGRRRPG